MKRKHADSSAIWIAAALAAASAVVLACAPAQYLGRQEDDLVYLILSQSLAHGSYRLATAVGRPLGVMFTPGWPAMLAPLGWLAPERLGAYELFAALLQAAVPWAAYAWLRLRLDRGAALLAALLCATSPLLLSQAGALMSETPFLLATLSLLRLLDRPRPRGVAAGGWLAALLQLRPAGLALAPAAVAPFLRARRWREAAWAAALPAAATGAWIAGSWLAVRRASIGPAKRAFLGRSWDYPIHVAAWEKLAFYARAMGDGLLPARWSEGRLATLATAVGLALLGTAALGAARALKRRWDDPAALALAGTAALYALWAWRYERYLIPLLPLLWWAVAAALGRAAKPALGAALALRLSFGIAPWLGGTTWRAPELGGTYAWLSRSLPADAALASAAYVRDGFYSGRPAAPLPDTADSAEFAAQLRSQRVRYALWQDELEIGTAGGAEAPLAASLRRARGHLEDAAYFKTIHADASERTRVFELQ